MVGQRLGLFSVVGQSWGAPMGEPLDCLLVPSVFGGELHASGRSLTGSQVRLLRFIAKGPPDRAMWTAKGRPRLAAVNLNAPPWASHLLVYRLGDGGAATRGEQTDRTQISVRDLRGLDGLWAVPLRSLNAAGLDLSGQRPEKRLNVVSWRMTDPEAEALKREAKARGVHASQILADALAEHLGARYPAFTRLASPEGSAASRLV